MTPLLLIFGYFVVAGGSFFFGILAQKSLGSSTGEVAELKNTVKALEDEKRKINGQRVLDSAKVRDEKDALVSQAVKAEQQYRETLHLSDALGRDILEIFRVSEATDDFDTLRSKVREIVTRLPNER